MSDKKIYGMYTLPATNCLTELISHNDLKTDKNENAEYKRDKNQIIIVEKYENVKSGLRPSALKLLDILQIALATNNTYNADFSKINNVVKIPINQLAYMLGKPNTKSSRDKLLQELVQDLMTLYSISFDWQGKNKKGKYSLKIRLCYMIGEVKNGELVFAFSPPVAEALVAGFVMQYPAALLKTDNRNETMYIIGKMLAEIHSNNENKKNSRADIISTAAISKRCNLDVTNIRNSGSRHTDRRIIKRVENALNALVKAGVISEWHYTHSKGVELTTEEKRAYKDKIPYDIFIKLYIRFTMPNDL